MNRLLVGFRSYGNPPRSDILVFLTGERDIRDTAKLLEGRRFGDTEIVPLYARLPAAQQRRAFVVGGRRRIILSTNVAETSVTIPGIRVVVDSGVARVKRYNPRTQVEKLHIEPISQASADQRKGRCGRVGPGICIRLFDEEEFAGRDPYTDPEIKRSSLASVILTMLQLNLGKVEHFPFLEPPSPPAIKDGYRELQELGALDGHKRLTALGRQLCRFSVEPRLARMLVEGHRQGVLNDVLTLVAALSTDDPRLRPPDKREESDRCHAQYAAETSDFSTLLRLWRLLQEKRQSLGSQRRFRTWCKANYLSYRRIREWDALREQLENELRQARFKVGTSAANEEKLHRSLLTGLLNKIGKRQERTGYRGARGVIFRVHPGSVLARSGPEWIMVAELVDTSRLFGRTVGTIEPEWIEQAGRHVARYRYGPPYWDEETGFVRAEETVMVYGLAVSEGRRRHFGPVDPVTSREIFIEHALVQGLIHAPPPVLKRNQAVVAQVKALEARVRKHDILAGDTELFAFYNARIPPEVHNTRALKQWLQEDATAAAAMALTAQDIMLREPEEVSGTKYPDHLDYRGQRLDLRYRFAHGEEDDGVTCRIPVALLQDLPAAPFDWLVPGLLEEKITALLKGLPKRLRRELVPVNRTTQTILEDVTPHGAPLRQTLARWILQHRGLSIPDEEWPPELPPHLDMHFEILDENGAVTSRGNEIEPLRATAAAAFEGAPASTETHVWQRDGITDWDFGPLPESVDVGSASWRVVQYPGLVDGGSAVSLRLFKTNFEANRAGSMGLARLTALRLTSREMKPLRQVADMPALSLLTLKALQGNITGLVDDLILRAIAESCRFVTDLPRDRASFESRIAGGKTDFYSETKRLSGLLEAFIEKAGALLPILETIPASPRQDLQRQLEGLFVRRFLRHTPSAQLAQYPRYLRGIEMRLERLRHGAEKDADRQCQLKPYLDQLDKTTTGDPAILETYRWMLEEWRISLFAQQLGTRTPVSPKRLAKLWVEAMG